MTVMGAVAAVAFVPPCVVPKAPTGMVLVLVPFVVLVSVTVIVQEPPLPVPGMVPPVNVTVVAPAFAVTMPPTQEVLAAGVGATDKWELVGEARLSVKFITVYGRVDGLVIVIVITVVLPDWNRRWGKSLCDGSPVTVKFAEYC